MGNFEFKSQICTSVEESKRLLELGLKKETADMCWQKTTFNGNVITYPAQDVWHCSTTITDYHTPAWSLHRLMEVMFNGDMFGFVGLTTHNRNIDTIYDLVIANIEGLIKINKFNKDYMD